MRENEFEKRVKTTIDEFRLRPSDTVWPALREEITDKKRRRVLLMVPILAALLGLGYFAWQSFFRPVKIKNSQELLATKKTTGPSAATENEKAPPSGTPVSGTDSLNKKHPGHPALPTLLENTSPGNDKKLAGNKADNKQTAKIATINRRSAVKLRRSEKQGSFTGKDHDHVVTVVHPVTGRQFPHAVAGAPAGKRRYPSNSPVAANARQTATVIRNEDSQTGPDNSPVMIEHTIPWPATTRLTVSEPLITINNEQLATLQNVKANGKLKWGFDFSVGGSSRIEKPFNVVSTEKSLASTGNFINYPVGVGTTGTVAGGVLILPPSSVKPGAGFKIGMVADKSVSGRVDITAGLQYVYASDRIMIGKTIAPAGYTITLPDRSYNTNNAIAQTSYSGMKPRQFTNKYHFVELPVMVRINLTQKWKVPVSWNAGISVGRLVASNALLYDEAWGGIYYEGKDNLSKTQVSVMTGFQVRLKGSNQWQWNIGPQISMNTTKLFQSNSDKNKHIVYGGVQVQLLLPRRQL